MDALLTVTNLSKTFGTGENAVQAVSNVSFSVKAGEVVGLMGPNGAGKSTTMRLIAGYVVPNGGDATIASHSITSNRLKAQQNLGYLAENPAQYDELTPYEYLTFMAESHGVQDIPQAITIASNLTRCHTFLHRPLADLSKGMRQRVFFAGAIVHNPPVLILDEPTDGLDPNQKHEMRLAMKELARTRAVIVSTHILEEAEAVCSRLIILNHGKVAMDTTPAELARQGKGDIQLAFRLLTQKSYSPRAAA